MSPTTDLSNLLYHRAATSTAVLRPLAFGAILIFLAPSLAATAFVGFKHAPTVKLILLITAGICVFMGPIVAVTKLVRIIREDAFIAARRKGVTFERNGKEAFLAWDDLERIEHQPPSTLIFHKRSGDDFVLHEEFDGTTVDDLAKKLEDMRRKASFALL